VHNILQDEDYVRGACSYSNRNKKDKQRLISERRTIVREMRSSEFLTLKMQATGFEVGKNMGLRAHHNVVADPEVPGLCVMVRRIPCLCPGCSLRFKKPVSERYTNPCDDSKYWQIYLGWNDWRKIEFNRGNCDMDDIVGAQQWTLSNIGARMAEKITVGKYGVYLVDDEMKYYLVQWTSNPWIVTDGPLETDGGVARVGELVCKGLWLNNVARAPLWFWLGEREVIVRCQFVLCPNLELHEHSTENDLPRMNATHRASILLLNPIRLSDDHHDMMMDAASVREGLDYYEDIP
jgi:hypothetical protein